MVDNNCICAQKVFGWYSSRIKCETSVVASCFYSVHFFLFLLFGIWKPWPHKPIHIAVNLSPQAFVIVPPDTFFFHNVFDLRWCVNFESGHMNLHSAGERVICSWLMVFKSLWLHEHSVAMMYMLCMYTHVFWKFAVIEKVGSKSRFW